MIGLALRRCLHPTENVSRPHGVQLERRFSNASRRHPHALELHVAGVRVQVQQRRGGGLAAFGVVVRRQHVLNGVTQARTPEGSLGQERHMSTIGRMLRISS